MELRRRGSHKSASDTQRSSDHEQSDPINSDAEENYDNVIMVPFSAKKPFYRATQAELCLYFEVSKTTFSEQQKSSHEADTSKDSSLKRPSKPYHDVHAIIQTAGWIFKDAGLDITIFPLQLPASEVLASSKDETEAYIMTIGINIFEELIKLVNLENVVSSVSAFSGYARSQQLTLVLMTQCAPQHNLYLQSGNLGFNGNETILRQLSKRNDIKVELFPLHRDDFREEMLRNWGQNMFSAPSLLDIYQYFGPRLGMYFAWLDFYTQCLFLPASCGLILVMIEWWSEPRLKWLIVSFSAFISLGTSVFVDFWRRKQRELEYKWKYEPPEEILITKTRPEFEGQWIKDPILQEDVYDFPQHKRLMRQFLVVPLVIIMCLAVCAYVIMLNMLSEHLRSTFSFCFKKNQSQVLDDLLIFCPVATQGTGMLNVVVIYTFDAIYLRLAKKLNDYENYRTTEEYDDHLILKRMPFHFVNSNASLWFLAFYIQDLQRARDRLWILMVAMQLADNLKEVGGPFIVSLLGKAHRRGYQDTASQANSSGPNAEIVRRILVQKRQAHYVDTFLDYKVPVAWNYNVLFASSVLNCLMYNHQEMLIQYGYVTLYSPIFPLAPLFALLNNVIERRTDFFKLTNSHGLQRPIAQHARGIGVWENMLICISVVAVIVNCGLIWVYELDELLPQATDVFKLTVVVMYEHAIFLIKALLNWAAPTVPTWIVNEKRIAAFNAQKKARCKSE